jgi:hypothetical protein
MRVLDDEGNIAQKVAPAAGGPSACIFAIELSD